MKRRSFLSMSAAASATLCLPRAFSAQVTASPGSSSSARYQNLLILIELKGGNDGLNTVIPFADPNYYTLRKNIAIKREQAIQLDERTALHPSLLPLMPLWHDRQLAIVQGVGYTQPNLSHFRSTEIWDTASRSDQYLREGWLTRAFAQAPVPENFAADGVVVGGVEMGPLANGARAITLRNSTQYLSASRDAMPASIRKSESQLRPTQYQARLGTEFPAGIFGNAIKTAMHTLAARGTSQPLSGRDVAAIRLTLNGFDTHQNQPGQHMALLKQLAEGLASLKKALVELGRWDRTLVMTYAEFGRSARENQSRGTDHGTVAPHFVMGARVRGGLYGTPPMLARLDANGNLPLGVDFRRLYASVLDSWWGLDASTILQQRFEPLPLLRV